MRALLPCGAYITIIIMISITIFEKIFLFGIKFLCRSVPECQTIRIMTTILDTIGVGESFKNQSN